MLKTQSPDYTSQVFEDFNGRFEEIDTNPECANEAEVELECKGNTVSGSDPPSDVAENGQTVSIGGLKRYSRQDLLEVPIPPLHFSKKQRGRLIVGAQVFDGSCLEDKDGMCPRN